MKFKEPVLKDYNGDLSKRWYIDYHFAEIKHRLKRRRVWVPDYQERAERKFMTKLVTLSLIVIKAH